MNTIDPRDRYARQALGVDLFLEIRKSKILLVGAGGIGCELLKNLVLTGFPEIHIIDLDTIDLSNLNRQFLFGHEHIKRAKAVVAKEAASRFNPRVNIEAHHANIKDPQFGLKWFRGFNIVFNALDNLDARRHVNKMCLAADVPLVESGTTGFNGQVQVIKKGISECYECNPKETPKTFPVCTIRSTPTQPIHCIVWAKSYLFSELFGVSEDESPELDTTEDSENAKEIEKLREEAQALKRIRESMGSTDFPRKVFEKVFMQDIDRLRGMDDMWKNREKPKALDVEKLSQDAMGVGEAIADQDQVTWTATENFAVFSLSLKRLSDRLEELRANAQVGNAAPVLSFDKDDKDTLDFVASAANLRSLIFHIETKSEFVIKQMAGNIIPAIATTNAMTASLCVLQSFKVLRGDYNKARMQFLSKSAERLISSEPLGRPRSDCPVCGVCQAVLNIDADRATVRDLVRGLLQGQLGYSEELSVSTDAGIIYDPDLDDNLDKKLTDLGVKQDGFITIKDEEDEQPRADVSLAISKETISPEYPPVSLAEKLVIPRKVKLAEPGPDGGINGFESIVQVNGTGVGSKRKREAGEPDLESDIKTKKGKVFEEIPIHTNGVQHDFDVLVIDDGVDGAIVIDED